MANVVAVVIFRIDLPGSGKLLLNSLEITLYLFVSLKTAIFDI